MSRSARKLAETADWLRRLADRAEAEGVPSIGQRCRAAARLVDGETVERVPEPVGAIHHRGVRQVFDRLVRASVEAWSSSAVTASEHLAAAAFYVAAGLDIEAER